MKKILVVVAACLALTACIHKTGGTVTPQERLMTDNAILAQFVNTAEQGTEATVTSGLITTVTARPIIAFEGQFASTHEQITKLLNQGLTTANLAQVQTLLANLKTTADTLVASGNIGVKNPKTQMTITADINNIIALTQAVLTDIQIIQAGGTQ